MIIKIKGVEYPVVFNMLAIAGVMQDSRTVTLEHLFDRFRAIAKDTEDATVTQNDLFELLQLGGIAIFHGMKNAALIDGKDIPFDRWEQVAAHVTKAKVAGQFCMLFFIELSKFNQQEEVEEVGEIVAVNP